MNKPFENDGINFEYKGYAKGGLSETTFKI